MNKIKVESTSFHSAEVVDPVILEEKKTTRKVAFFRINDTHKDKGETVSVNLAHQRKGPNDEWEDVESIHLNTLKAGEGVRLDLNRTITKKLYQKLMLLYGFVEKKGIPFGVNEFTISRADEIIQVPENRKVFIERLLSENYGEEVWKELLNTQPDLATRFSLARVQSERIDTLEEFKRNLDDNNADESYWQKFFKDNQWIFGYGLNYQFLYELKNQPEYGGKNYTGRGSQKGDYMLHTTADSKFTVLVEIKTPATPLLSYNRSPRQPKEIRNDTWLLSSHLLGAVSQIQVNCRTWSIDSQKAENVRPLEKSGIFTVEPKGILVIGSMSELSQDESIISCFESFRRNITNPQILTFDELYQRATFIVSQTSERESHDKKDFPF